MFAGTVLTLQGCQEQDRKSFPFRPGDYATSVYI